MAAVVALWTLDWRDAVKCNLRHDRQDRMSGLPVIIMLYVVTTRDVESQVTLTRRSQ